MKILFGTLLLYFIFFDNLFASDIKLPELTIPKDFVYEITTNDPQSLIDEIIKIQFKTTLRTKTDNLKIAMLYRAYLQVLQQQGTERKNYEFIDALMHYAEFGFYKKGEFKEALIIYKFIYQNFPWKKKEWETEIDIWKANVKYIHTLFLTGDKKQGCIEADKFRKNPAYYRIFANKSLKSSWFMKNHFKDIERYKITYNCGQINLAENKTFDKNTKELTGFKIDLLETDTNLKEKFQKYFLVFDFKNFRMLQVIKKNNHELENYYDILSITKKKISMKLSVGELFKNCKNNPGEALYNIDCPNHKQWKRTFYDLHKRGIESKPNSSEIFDKDYEKMKNMNATEISFLSLNSYEENDAYKLMDYSFKNGKIVQTFWPNSLFYKTVVANKGFEKFKYDLENLSINDKNKNFINTLLFVASAYMLYNNFKDIKNISKNTKHKKKISGNSSSFSNPSNFAGRSLQQKYKILRYYGYLR